MSKLAKETKTRERLVLLDAHAVLHRAYHALPEFSTSKGEPTGALYGLASMILKIVSELKPDFLLACYDLPKPTYRHEIYEQYKAGRVKAEEDLKIQIEKSRGVCEALGIKIYDKEGFEADDVLGTIVERMRGGGVEIIIASGDMDTLQLIDDDYVKVYTLKKGLSDTILYDEKKVEERFGFGPKLLPDYKGLRGDPSDNIIGIKGIGEKTATDLIKNFGSLENIYKNIDNAEKMKKAGIKERIIDLMKNGKEEAEFSKMLATIRRDAPIDFSLPNKRWAEEMDIERAKNLFNSLEFRTMGARLEDVLRKNGREILVEEKSPSEELPPSDLEELKVALWVTDSNKTDPSEEDILAFAKVNSLKEAKEVIFREMDKRESRFVFEEIEKPLIPIIKEMSRYGVLINKNLFSELNKKYSGELEKIEKKIWELSGEKFNVSSPKQLGEVLFGKLNLTAKNQKKTSSGAKSTRESELEKIKDLHPIVSEVLEYRELSKLISTYIEPIPKLLDKDLRLHARFIQTGSTTGRMASSSPNLQNIPVGSDRGRAIRVAFTAPPGSTLLSFDYSQIELRIAAILSHDKKLKEIFEAGDDIHTGVASRIFKVEKDQVSKEMRRQAKVINFGILYGMGVNALMGNLGTDRKTAQDFHNKYFEEFSGLAKYLDNIKIEASKNGWTKTIFGRRRYFEGIKSKVPYIKAAAERMALNAPIQGTQADLVKMAMRKIDEWLKQEGLDSKIHLLLQIHDELVYEVEESELEQANKNISKIMQEVMPQEITDGVPIVVHMASGKNWGEME